MTLTDIDFGVSTYPLVLITDDLQCDGHFALLASIRQAISEGRKASQTGRWLQ